MPLYDFRCDKCGAASEVLVPYDERECVEGVCDAVAACCSYPFADSICESMQDTDDYHHCKGVTCYAGKLGRNTTQTLYTGIEKYLRRFRR